MAGSARKPYLRLKKSLVDFFRAPIVYLKQINQKFSEFEKPYLEGEYPQMHLEWPNWNWGPWEVRRPGPLSPFGLVPTIYTVGCVVHCWHWNDCNEWVECSVLHWGGDLGKQGSFEVTGDVLEVEEVWGGTVDLRFRVNSEVAEPVVTVKYTDPTNQRCYEDIAITCVTCDPAALIGYTTRQMQVDGEQTLEAQVGGELDTDTSYTWAIVSGGGTLDSNTGNSVTYTAPSTNEDCLNNPTITLSCAGVQLDSLEIAVNELGGSVEAALEGAWATPTPPVEAYGIARTLNCNSVWWKTEFWGKCNGAPYYTGTTTAGVCGNYGSLQSCIDNCIVAFFNGVIGFTDWPNDIVDTRDAQELEDGCCPKVLL